jgi:uncharacterized protein YmfQ (DUF2313 family)
MIEKKTIEETTNSVAAFMPGGRVFAAKNRDGSTLRNFLVGLSIELQRIEELMGLMYDNYDIRFTEEFITEWESSVNIPDDIFDGTGSLEDRRTAVLAKFAKMNVTTEQDFIDLAALFGVSIEITQGGDEYVFPLTFPISLIPTSKQARFTMIVRFPGESEVFPLAFPIPFGFPKINIIKGLFDKVKPANVKIIYI